MRNLIIAATFLLWPAAALADGTGDIQAALDQWLASYNAGDAASVAGFYTEDTIILLPDGGRIDGRPGVQEMMAELIGAGITYDNIDVTEAGMDGDLAWNAGTFLAEVPIEGAGSIEAAGTYLVIWRKDADGAWRILVDTWNDAAGEE